MGLCPRLGWGGGRGAYNRMLFCLFLDGPITGPSGGRGLISVCVWGGGGESTSGTTVLFTITGEKNIVVQNQERIR